MLVRPARSDEVEALQRLEVAAGRQFAEVGMATIAADEPPEAGLLEAAIGDGRLWVAESDLGEVIGYAWGVLVGGLPHLEQISVDPVAQGRGVGRALVNAVANWAIEIGADALTLTTFRDVSWNRPLYERLDFVVVPEADLTEALRAVRAHEVEIGLDDVGPRVTMRRLL